MADPLLYNALDSYLYMDTMLAKATAQASAADTNRATKSTLAPHKSPQVAEETNEFGTVQK